MFFTKFTKQKYVCKRIPNLAQVLLSVFATHFLFPSTDKFEKCGKIPIFGVFKGTLTRAFGLDFYHSLTYGAVLYLHARTFDLFWLNSSGYINIMFGTVPNPKHLIVII